MHEEQLNKGRMRGEIHAQIALVLLGLVVITIYSNTFHAAWHLDDKPNILENALLHIDDLHPSTLWNTFFAKKEGEQNEFYRPLPSLSFALNWYWGQDNTFGFHLVNLFIHIISSITLYLASYNLFLTPNIKKYYGTDAAASIALLNAVLWAANPVQTQAVTYIVQRMASMAAMFYIMGVYCFLRARTETLRNGKKAILFYVGCFASFFGAVLSKENAIMLPVSLGLIELIFYRNIKSLIRKRIFIYISVAVLAMVILFSVVFVATEGFGRFSKGYDSRSFSMVERLLTQPRILILYLSQLFYPLPGRLSISHDIMVSTSLFTPWNTLPSILACFLLIGLGIWQMVKSPLLALGILFFFLNHTIESSAIPLELVFEHRNYLPSFFVFLPFSAMLVNMIRDYKKRRQRSMVMVLTAFVALLIIGLGCFTYVRNRDWRTETSLWRDAMYKAPKDARPAWNVAIAMAWDKNVTQRQLDAALVLFEKSLSMNHARKEHPSRILRNMGLIHLHRREYEKAVERFRQSLQIDSIFREGLLDLASAYIMMGRWDAASEQLDPILPAAEAGAAPDYYKMKGYILLWKEQPENALKYLKKALIIEPENPDVLLNTGVALSWLEKYDNARLYLHKARIMSPNNIRYHYGLIENSARAGKLEEATEYARQMLKTFSIKSVFDGLDALRDNFRTAPADLRLIIPIVQEGAGKALQEIEVLSGGHA